LLLIPKEGSSMLRTTDNTVSVILEI